MDHLAGLERLLGWWVVPLLLLAIWVGIFVLVSVWQRQLKARLHQVIPGFNHIQLECRQLAAALRPYSPDDPPPYGALVVITQRHLDSIANHLVALKKIYVGLQERVRKINFHTWQKLLGAPFYWYTWYQLRAEAGGLLVRITELDGQLKSVRDKLEEIDRQAWLAAGEARKALGREQEIRRLMEYLGDRKLIGDEFESAATQEEQVIDALDLVPRFFFIADEQAVDSQATKDGVCEVYAILTRINPILDDLEQRLGSWEQQYQALTAKATRMQQQVNRTKNLLTNLPENLIATEQSEQVKSVETVANTLSDTLSRLEVGSIPLVEQEIEHTTQAATEIGSGIRRGLRQHASLSLVIIELLQLQEDLSGLISGLAKRNKYPLVWDQSRSAFRELNKQIATLGEANQPRPILDIDPTLDKSSHLLARLKDLAGHCQDISANYDELVVLLLSEEILLIPEWYPRAVELAGQVAVYHTDNWPKQASVSMFFEETQYLYSRYQNLMPSEATQSLKESEIKTLLADIRSLVNDYRALHGRSEEIQSRLETIQDTETQARDNLSSARNQFHQISWLINSNPFLKGLASGDLERLRHALDRQSQALSQQQNDLVERKAYQVKKVIDDLDLNANRWLVALTQDTLKRQQDMAVKLEKLREYAILEDPAIEKVKRLETVKLQHSTQVQGAPTFQMPLQDIVGELQKRSNTWQECVAVQQELEELVETPLTDAVLNAQKQRHRALELMSNARRLVPGKRSWPATSVNLQEQERSIDELEAQWQGMKTQRIRAIWAVRRYGELAASYQTQASKTEQALQWASQEQKRVLDAETEIERLIRFMQRQELSAADDPLTAEKYNRIRIKAILALDKVKQDWLASGDAQTGEPDYDEVMQALLNILNSMRSSIDVDGDISRRGEKST